VLEAARDAADEERDVVSWLHAIRFCNAAFEWEGLDPAYTYDGEDVTWHVDADGCRLPTAKAENVRVSGSNERKSRVAALSAEIVTSTDASPVLNRTTAPSTGADEAPSAGASAQGAGVGAVADAGGDDRSGSASGGAGLEHAVAMNTTAIIAVAVKSRRIVVLRSVQKVSSTLVARRSSIAR
jgi:hypothetical protein